MLSGYVPAPNASLYCFTVEGLHLMAGSKEDAETVTAFFEDIERCEGSMSRVARVLRVQAAYQAPSRAIARELAAGVVIDYRVSGDLGRRTRHYQGAASRTGLWRVLWMTSKPALRTRNSQLPIAERVLRHFGRQVAHAMGKAALLRRTAVQGKFSAGARCVGNTLRS